MALTKIKVINICFRGINLCEMLINKLFVWLRAKKNNTSRASAVTPNDPHGWENVYLSDVKPVKEVKSEIANIIISHSNEGDTLLETGCGSGNLSAELALAGRDVSICDFSQPILDRVKLLFNMSGLKDPGSYLVDLTRPFPFNDKQFDIVWSSGVLEHWTDEELQPIVDEQARCAKRCVISLVPNEKSVFYRFGRETAEQQGIAPWGREIPRSSLKAIFESAGLINVKESTVCIADAPNLIGMIDPVFQKKVSHWWRTIPDNDPVKDWQGYLLLTVGFKNTE